MRILVSFLLLLSFAGTLAAQPNPAPVARPADTGPWPQHSMERPLPPVVLTSGLVVVPPPADAFVLVDGRTMAQWASNDGSRREVRWNLTEGTMEIRPGTESIESRPFFGDLQLHLEWGAPQLMSGEGQERGNSGILFMGRYELQILDSYRNRTYADGVAGAIYGQFPPMVSPVRKPIEWNSYDVIFRRPRFDAEGKLVAPARMTVLYNGVLVHADRELLGPTGHGVQEPYSAHPDRLPLVLEYRGTGVRFRNMWVRSLE